MDASGLEVVPELESWRSSVARDCLVRAGAAECVVCTSDMR
jgi:hypothetical protein